LNVGVIEKVKLKHLNIRDYISKRLVTQLRLYTILFFVMLGVVVYEVFLGSISIFLAFVGFLIGFGVGVLVSRMIHLSWDEDSNMVIGRMDWIGAVVLVIYFIFSIARTIYLGYFIQGTAFIVIIICITGGSMLGRSMGTSHGIRRILKAWDIIR
jgi:hypothetical protein